MTQKKDSYFSDEVFEQLSTLLGEDRVLTDQATIKTYAQSTSSNSTWPLSILYPRSTQEIVSIVEICNNFQIPLYPISGGKNWGYGDSCAVSDKQIILDLSQMNQIIEVDETLAYAVIEPGVTQKQLSDYLRKHNYSLWMDCTGAGPDTSIVGNIMDRGFGHTCNGIRVQNIAGLEIVLANAKVLNTGFGHYNQSRTTNLYPFGVGPYLDGIFTQSNFGIVTSLAFWLMPAYECVNHFLCSIDKYEDIQSAVDSLRPLRLDGTLRSVIHIGNDLRLISGSCTYPIEQTEGRVPLPPKVHQKLRNEAKVGAWTISGAIYGRASQVSVTKRILRKTLRGAGKKLIFLDDQKLLIASFFAKLLGNSSFGRKLMANIQTAKALFDLNRGVPSGKFLAGAYWRRKDGLPANFPSGANPATDNCGMLWLSPVIPMRGKDVIQLHDIVVPLFDQHGFDFFITLSTVNDRSLGAVITITYDKDDQEETIRAKACYQDSFDAVMKAGYIPYRVGIQSMADLSQVDDVFWETVSAIKSSIDPNNIISPGRYDNTIKKQ